MNPRVKVIIAGGYSVNGPMKETLQAGSRGFGARPFDLKQMLRVVGRVLEET